MDPNAYFLPQSANDDDFASWHPLVPAGAKILCTNLFGDTFFVDDAGAVHMLERGATTVQAIAPSEEEFRSAITDDSEGWQLRPLADRCRSAGKILDEGQCYAFSILPVLGGEYDVENVWVAPWREWFALTADIYNQLKDVPDGTPVRLNVAKNPNDGTPAKGKSGLLGKLFSR